MKVKLYILGFLKRHGAQHGYALKQLLSRNASDFANIKISNIYYHFDKMCQQGLVSVSLEKEGRRPDRQVYSITKAGEQAFATLLEKSLALPFDFESILDAPLFFSEYADHKQISEAVQNRILQLEEAIDYIQRHRCRVLDEIPDLFHDYAVLLFDHHLIHFKAEMKWSRKAREVFKD